MDIDEIEVGATMGALSLANRRSDRANEKSYTRILLDHKNRIIIVELTNLVSVYSALARIPESYTVALIWRQSSRALARLQLSIDGIWLLDPV